jgi:hypothetical protein
VTTSGDSGPHEREKRPETGVPEPEPERERQSDVEREQDPGDDGMIQPEVRRDRAGRVPGPEDRPQRPGSGNQVEREQDQQEDPEGEGDARLLP